VDEAALQDSEIQLALRLIEQTSSEAFHPERYEDAVKKRVQEAIERKVQGQEIQVASPEPQAQVIDLMEALKASLAAAGKAPPSAAAQPAPADAAAPPATSERKPARRARPREDRAKSSSRK
jgi:DNA end-binding protein Ku